MKIAETTTEKLLKLQKTYKGVLAASLILEVAIVFTLFLLKAKFVSYVSVLGLIGAFLPISIKLKEIETELKARQNELPNL